MIAALRTQLRDPSNRSLWVAGVAVCMLAVAGYMADARSTPAHAASAASSGAPAPMPLTSARTASNRNWGSCADCGVVESSAATHVGYETTVRFRDGKTMAFNEATRRTWRSGDRVIVISRASALNN